MDFVYTYEWASNEQVISWLLMSFEQDSYEMLNLTNKEAVKEFEVETSTVKSTVILLQALLPNSTISHITTVNVSYK